MKKNVGNYERVFRGVGGLLLSSLAFWGPKKLGFLSFLIPVASGAVGKCPLYSAMKVNTRKSEKELANDYIPVQSPSEEALGHPIVGVA